MKKINKNLVLNSYFFLDKKHNFLIDFFTHFWYNINNVNGGKYGRK